MRNGTTNARPLTRWTGGPASIRRSGVWDVRARERQRQTYERKGFTPEGQQWSGHEEALRLRYELSSLFLGGRANDGTGIPRPGHNEYCMRALRSSSFGTGKETMGEPLLCEALSTTPCDALGRLAHAKQRQARLCRVSTLDHSLSESPRPDC